MRTLYRAGLAVARGFLLNAASGHRRAAWPGPRCGQSRRPGATSCLHTADLWSGGEGSYRLRGDGVGDQTPPQDPLDRSSPRRVDAGAAPYGTPRRLATGASVAALPRPGVGSPRVSGRDLARAPLIAAPRRVGHSPGKRPCGALSSPPPPAALSGSRGREAREGLASEFGYSVSGWRRLSEPGGKRLGETGDTRCCRQLVTVSGERRGELDRFGLRLAPGV